MDPLLLGVLLSLVIVNIVLVLLFLKRKETPDSSTSSVPPFVIELQKEITGLRGVLNTQILELSNQLNQQLHKNNQFLAQTQDGYRDAVGQVQHRLGELQQATRSMIEIGKDISSLQNILKSPKLRGELGQFFLAELLKQFLPEDNFTLQYGFKNGTKVDAAILLPEGIIPVDAKFPLENFERILKASGDEEARQAKKEFVRDVKKHIDDIAAKYILPEERTFDFALMVIPAENIYYETIIKDELQTESIAAYAQRKHVISVSPNSFYAYLQVIGHGLKGLRIERSAQLILESLSQLDVDFKKCMLDFEKVGTHLNNAQSAYKNAEKRMNRLQDKLEFISSEKKDSAEPLFPEPVTENP